MLLSYMLNESRITELSRSLKRIIVITFAAKAAGATVLCVLFRPVAESFGHRVLLSVFHAVSAFCNAGFALFSTSLEQFHDNLGINVVISALIVGGVFAWGAVSRRVLSVGHVANGRTNAAGEAPNSETGGDGARSGAPHPIRALLRRFTRKGPP